MRNGVVHKMVEAENWQEAMAQAPWKIGEQAVIADIKAFCNDRGEWTVYPTFGIGDLSDTPKR